MAIIHIYLNNIEFSKKGQHLSVKLKKQDDEKVNFD
jgi:hypothetical protein